MFSNFLLTARVECGANGLRVKDIRMWVSYSVSFLGPLPSALRHSKRLLVMYQTKLCRSHALEHGRGGDQGPPHPTYPILRLDAVYLPGPFQLQSSLFSIVELPTAYSIEIAPFALLISPFKTKVSSAFSLRYQEGILSTSSCSEKKNLSKNSSNEAER